MSTEHDIIDMLRLNREALDRLSPWQRVALAIEILETVSGSLHTIAIVRTATKALTRLRDHFD